MYSFYDVTFNTIENKREYSYGDKLKKPKNIIRPSEILPSENIKVATECGYMARCYIDNNVEKKKIIIKYLENIVEVLPLNKFFDKIIKIAEKNRYFIQTDIIGAYYNITLDTVYSLIDEFVIDESHNAYLKGFYKYVQETYNEHNYLYLTEYSDFLFTLYLNKIFKNEKILFKKDDMLLYGDDMLDLNNTFEKISKLLKENGLYINPKKTFIIDIMYDSIYIFRTIVSIPKIEILDERIKMIIEEKVKKNIKLNIYQFNGVLYNFINSLKNDNVSLKLYINLPFYKKIYYSFNKKLYYSNKTYVPNQHKYFNLGFFEKNETIEVDSNSCEEDDLYSYT